MAQFINKVTSIFTQQICHLISENAFFVYLLIVATSQSMQVYRFQARICV